MTASVRIATGSRLHFGPLANLARYGRRFGGLGVMIEEPGFELIVRQSASDEFNAEPELASRAASIVQAYRDSAPGNLPSHGYQFDVNHVIPSHVGLGSGTQFALAVAAGCSVVDGVNYDDPRVLAARVGRGNRSALGLFGFHQGGFLIDAGKPHEHAISPVVARQNFPEEWRFVLITPPKLQGVSGQAEAQAFDALSPMAPETTQQLCHVALMRILPGIVDGIFEEVASGLWDFGRIVGDYFAPGQGGRFADPRMAKLVRYLRDQGIQGVGQSSWGPTIFALTESEISGKQLIRDLAASEWKDCEIRLVMPRNRGADITDLP